MNATDYLQKAIESAGGQTALAERINQHLPSGTKAVSQANIWSWLHRSEKVPPEYGVALQLACDGKVLASQVCPETFRPELAYLVFHSASIA